MNTLKPGTFIYMNTLKPGTFIYMNTLKPANREVDEVPTKDYSCMKQIITRFVFKYIKLK
jgi:hypothetical protein